MSFSTIVEVAAADYEEFDDYCAALRRLGVKVLLNIQP